MTFRHRTHCMHLFDWVQNTTCTFSHSCIDCADQRSHHGPPSHNCETRAPMLEIVWNSETKDANCSIDSKDWFKCEVVGCLMFEIALLHVQPKSYSEQFAQIYMYVFMYYSPHLKWNLFCGSMCALCARTPTCCSKAPSKAQAEVGHNVPWPGSAGKFSLRWKYKTLLLPLLLLVRFSSGVMGPPYIGMTGNVQRTDVHPHIQAFPSFFFDWEDTPYTVFTGSIDNAELFLSICCLWKSKEATSMRKIQGGAMNSFSLKMHLSKPFCLNRYEADAVRFNCLFCSSLKAVEARAGWPFS